MVAAGASAAAGTVYCVVFLCYGVRDTKNVYNVKYIYLYGCINGRGKSYKYK